MRGDIICPICTITSLGHQQAPRGGGGAKTTEVGTVQSLPCSNPSAAVLCHNKPVLKKSPGWWWKFDKHEHFNCLSVINCIIITSSLSDHFSRLTTHLKINEFWTGKGTRVRAQGQWNPSYQNMFRVSQLLSGIGLSCKQLHLLWGEFNTFAKLSLFVIVVLLGIHGMMETPSNEKFQWHFHTCPVVRIECQTLFCITIPTGLNACKRSTSLGWH